eukprot:Lankesteria_metandrocarpae@DN4645_c0_g1_i4.p1
MDPLGFYALLGVPCSATVQEIRATFKIRAVQTHPDKNPDNPDDAKEEFQRLTIAYEVLKNQILRKDYDAGNILSEEEIHNSVTRPSTDYFVVVRGRAGPRDGQSVNLRWYKILHHSSLHKL